MAQVSFNKDGQPRKRGSGKTKGAGCFSKIKWNELKEHVGENVPIPVSRVWLRNLGVPVEEAIKAQKEPTNEPSEDIDAQKTQGPETESPLESAEDPVAAESSLEEKTDTVAVTPPYRYAKNFNL